MKKSVYLEENICPIGGYEVKMILVPLNSAIFLKYFSCILITFYCRMISKQTPHTQQYLQLCKAKTISLTEGEVTELLYSEKKSCQFSQPTEESMWYSHVFHVPGNIQCANLSPLPHFPHLYHIKFYHVIGKDTGKF